MHTHAPAAIMQTEMIVFFFILQRSIDIMNKSITKAQF